MGAPLVAREAELEVLRHAAQQVATGVGGCVCVLGEAGIGKSSLLEAWLDGLAHGIATRTARAVPPDEHRPLAVLRRLLPTVEASSPDDAIEVVLREAERAARRGPLVLALDDLHLADPLTLDVLPSLVARAADLGILLVLAARSETRSSRLALVIDGAGRHGTCVQLRPLEDEYDVRALVRLRLGVPAGPRLVAALAATAGNPFLVDEYLRCLVDDGTIRTACRTPSLRSNRLV